MNWRFVRRAGAAPRTANFPRFRPGSRSPLPASEWLTLPDGRRVRAGEFYDAINALEREANRASLSLDETTIGARAGVPELLEVPRDDAVLRRQATAIREAFSGEPLIGLALRPPSRSDEAARRRALRDAPRFSVPAGAGLAKEFRQVFGDGPMQVSLQGKQEVTPSETGVRFSGSLAAGVRLLGTETNALNLTYEVDAPTQGVKSLRLRGEIDGKPFLNVDRQPMEDTAREDNTSHPFTFPVRLSKRLGPIPISFTATASGESGVQASTTVGPASLTASHKPFVRAGLALSGGRDHIVGGIRFEGNLKLLDLALDGSALARIDRPTPENGAPARFVCEESLQLGGTMEALMGSASVVVYVYVPRFGAPPWKKKEFQLTLWNGKGVQANGSLVNEKKTVPLSSG